MTGCPSVTQRRKIGDEDREIEWRGDRYSDHRAAGGGAGTSPFACEDQARPGGDAFVIQTRSGGPYTAFGIRSAIDRAAIRAGYTRPRTARARDSPRRISVPTPQAVRKRRDTH